MWGFVPRVRIVGIAAEDELHEYLNDTESIVSCTWAH